MHFEYKNLLVQVSEQWSQFFRPGAFNWLDVRLLHLGFEWYRSMGNFELEVGVLGLNLRLAYTYDHETEDRKTVTQRYEEFMAEATVAVPGARYDELKEKAEKWDNYVKESIR